MRERYASLFENRSRKSLEELRVARKRRLTATPHKEELALEVIELLRARARVHDVP